MFKLKNKSINTDFNDLPLKVFKDITNAEENEFLASYNLPKDVFYFDKIKPVAPRYERIINAQLGETIIIVISNVNPAKPPTIVENRLETHVFLISEKESFWFIKDGYSNLYDQLVSTYLDEINTIEDFIMYSILLSYINFTKELEFHKQKINYLNNQANHQTSNQILNEVTQTEQNLVILEHTIQTQEIAINNLLDDDEFTNTLDNDMLVHDVKWYNRQVNRLVHVYRDLFDAVSSLFSDIVSNNLNILMKFLSSISIVLAASSFIAELWGMNTGGLPFEFNDYGFLIMFIVSLISGFSMYLFLKNKHYFDD